MLAANGGARLALAVHRPLMETEHGGGVAVQRLDALPSRPPALRLHRLRPHRASVARACPTHNGGMAKDKPGQRDGMCGRTAALDDRHAMRSRGAHSRPSPPWGPFGLEIVKSVYIHTPAFLLNATRHATPTHVGRRRFCRAMASNPLRPRFHRPLRPPPLSQRRLHEWRTLHSRVEAQPRSGH